MRSLLHFACLSLVGCQSASQGSTFDSGLAADAALDGPPHDAFAITCNGVLVDAGFSSLTDFPVASVCTQAYSVIESPTPCQGSVLVEAATGIDCGSFWLFDASTGALEAQGGSCNNDYSCTAAVPGFVFPSACFDPASWGWSGPIEHLCPDAGADAGADAQDSSSG